MARGRSGRGGYQAPRNGGGASAPGALSQRKVPHLERSGLPYGENKAVNEQQSAAPMSPQGAPGGGGPPSPRQGAQRGPNGVFGPSERPQEPLTAGVDFGPGRGAPVLPPMDPDSNYYLRAVAAEVPELADYLLTLIDE